MPNTVELQTINDGPRNLVLHLHIDGDGSGDLSAQKIIDASSYLYSPTKLRLLILQAEFTGFTGELIWDATTPKHCFEIPDYDVDKDFTKFGGIPNNAGTGITGDVLLTTVGLGSGDTGHAILHFIKCYESL